MFRWFETFQNVQARNVRGKCNWYNCMKGLFVCVTVWHENHEILKGRWVPASAFPLSLSCCMKTCPDFQGFSWRFWKQRAAKILAASVLRLDSNLHLLVESRHPHNLWDHLTGLTGHKVINETSLARLASLDTFSIIIQKAAIMKDLNPKWLEWQKQVCCDVLCLSLAHFV